MLTVKQNPQDQATLALSYFFRGLVVADGGLSKAEEGKVGILIYKFRHSLPGDNETIIANLSAIAEDPDYATWSPDRYIDEALMHYDAFVASGEADTDQLVGLLECLELVQEVGNVTEGEKKYMNRIQDEFRTRYQLEI
jgi:hypothetical protein